MAGTHINKVIVTGNLTRDPELKSLSSGTDVCKLSIAVNGSRKDGTGQWVDDPNFFNVTVWGRQAVNCGQYLSKGSPVAIAGRLDWRSWEADDGSKRSAVEIIAEQVQFLGGGGGQDSETAPAASDEAPAVSDEDFADDDDIPF